MTGRKTRILIVDDEESCRLHLRYCLQDDFEVLGDVKSGDDAVAECRNSLPDIVIIDQDMPGTNGIETTEIITDLFPSVMTIILLKDDAIDAVHKAMTAGARDFIIKPVKRHELLEVVKRTARHHHERRVLLQDRTDIPGAGIWCFANGNGGIGQTMLVNSIANELLSLEKRSVVIVDMDMLFGDVLLQLNITPGNSNLASLLANEPPYTLEHIEENLSIHSSGLKVLAAPTDTATAAAVNLERVTELVLCLERYFDYILLDLPTGIDDNYVHILDNSRFIFLPSNGSLGGIKNLRVLLTIFNELNYPSGKIRPVLLESDGEYAPVDELNTFLAKSGVEFAHTFPHDAKTAKAALSVGQPISRFAPKSSYTRKVRDFLIPLLHLPPVEKTSRKVRSFFSGIFS